MNMRKDFLARYDSGDCVQVWRELRELGTLVREPEYLDQALAVAQETMRRVRTNAESVYHRLLDAGYQFQYPEDAFIPPDSPSSSLLESVQQMVGYLPLSLMAFYLEVGSVNFMQSKRQLVQYHRAERESVPELAVLGEQDPLVVEPISTFASQLTVNAKARKFDFAPDKFHKAYYSGGENYHVLLPDASADFRIKGMYDLDEYFVDYLRATFQFGGFRGPMDPSVIDRGQKTSPNLRIIHKLAAGLLHF